ncbi:MAG TPA: hypothetical protein VFV83_09865, partial [Chthoniobacteraceae bacterium]|nr:hypothetical protein [Chthoniobacteraceae bacterium]
MKSIPSPRLFAVALLLLGALIPAHAAKWTEGMKEGAPGLKSIGPLAFGPDGILFVADTAGAAIVAIDTGDTTAAKGPTKPLKVEGINQKIAALLGTSADQILINDLAVN